MVEDIKSDKIVDLKEFKDAGYLQELNRRFLHPLGMAMEILVDEQSGYAAFGGIHDMRDRQEGCTFKLSEERTDERAKKFIINRDRINDEIQKRKEHRKKLFGGDTFIEPIPTSE